MEQLDPFLHCTHIAYFSMEIALRPEIHTYSGGLGMLAGDTARSAADLEMPVVFVTLASRAGYLRQEIGPDGRQIDHPDPWDSGLGPTRSAPRSRSGSRAARSGCGPGCTVCRAAPASRCRCCCWTPISRRTPPTIGA